MSYDYAGNRRCQYDFPRSAQPFRPYQPVQPRRVTCWDPPGSRVEVLRPPSWPDPEPPYVSHHLDPPDRRPRPRYQPDGYRNRLQDTWARHRGGYAERVGHLSNRGDQQTQLGFDRHPSHETQRRRQPTCWDPPWTRRTTAYQHSSSYELDMYSPSPPKRRPTCWDPPVYRETPRQHPFNEVSVYDQPLAPVPNSRRNQPYTAHAPPLPEPQPHPTPSPPYEQRTRRSYLPHSQPPLVRSSSSGYTARQNANQRSSSTNAMGTTPGSVGPTSGGLAAEVQGREADRYRLQPIRVSNAEKADRARKGLCYHCPEKWVPGHVCKVKLLCYMDDVADDANDNESGDGRTDKDLCDSKDSILETGAKEARDRGVPSENKGSRESGDGRPEDQQVSSFMEIYLSRSPDMSKDKKEEAWLDDVEEDDSTDEVKKVVASLNVVQVPSKNMVGHCWGKKGDGAYTDLPVIACVYVDLNVGDVPSMNHRSTSLDTDARLIPPRNDTPCLSILGGVDKLFVLTWNFSDHIGSHLLIFLGGDKGRYSVYVFDPGGDASPRLLLSTLAVALWFPP